MVELKNLVVINEYEKDKYKLEKYIEDIGKIDARNDVLSYEKNLVKCWHVLSKGHIVVAGTEEDIEDYLEENFEEDLIKRYLDESNEEAKENTSDIIDRLNQALKELNPYLEGKNNLQKLFAYVSDESFREACHNFVEMMEEYSEEVLLICSIMQESILAAVESKHFLTMSNKVNTVFGAEFYEVLYKATNDMGDNK